MKIVAEYVVTETSVIHRGYGDERTAIGYKVRLKSDPTETNHDTVGIAELAIPNSQYTLTLGDKVQLTIEAGPGGERLAETMPARALPVEVDA
jgi:hypothetical protein